MKKIFFLLCVLLLAVLMDMSSYKIKNELIIMGMLHGVFWNLYWFNSNRLWHYLLSAIGIVLLLLPLFSWRVFGAGDVKLLGVVALHLGFKNTIGCIGAALIIGAVIGICKALYHRKIKGEVIHFSIPILSSVAIHLVGGNIWVIF